MLRKSPVQVITAAETRADSRIHGIVIARYIEYVYGNFFINQKLLL